MSNRRLMTIGGFFLGVLLLLSACEPSSPTPLPTCTEGALQAPIELAPSGETVVVDGTVMQYLSWSYPSTTCTPDFFQAFLWTGLESVTPGMTGRVDYADISSSGKWQLPWPVVPLQPGRMYRWWVRAGLEAGPGTDPTGPSTRGYFFTGPECPLGQVYQPVDLLSPADGITVALTDTITFGWDDTTGCLVHGLYAIDFSLNATMSPREYGIPILQSVYSTTPADIGLSECTKYYWRIKTDPSGPPEEPFSAIRSFTVHSPGALCALPAPIGRAMIDLSCRSGPGLFYNAQDTFLADTTAPIEGRNEDSTWWYILSPRDNIHCWVPGQQVTVEGDTSQIPLAPYQPLLVETATDTPAPVNCAQYTDANSCMGNPACNWERYQSTQGGHCVNK